MRSSLGKTDGRHLQLVDSHDSGEETVCIWMLGGFRVSAGARALKHNDWKLKKAANLVKLLALEPRGRMHRERVVDFLWHDLNPRQAANNLHRTLHEARKTLGTPGTSLAYLQLREDHVTLAPDAPLWTDVEAFRDLAAAARDSREITAYRRALSSYAGELLPDDLYEEWTDDCRRDLAETHLSLRLEVADLYEGRGEYRQAIEILEQISADNPSHEEVQATLMRLYALTGRRRKALGQYERLSQVLRVELEAEPAPETETLYDRIRRNDFPAIESPSVGPSTPSAGPPHNLPIPRTSFIGREREISELKRLLTTTRLLTVTGVGGSGKTRLALEVARELLELHPDGAWLVGLSSITEPALVPRAAAQVFGIREQPDRALEETLAASLNGKDLLLILDNCEQVVEAAAKLAETLLDRCPGLKVLATSRELLSVEGEVSWTAPALSLPGPDSALEVEDLRESESVRLFVDRAAHRQTSFSLMQSNADSVAEICQKLDGIPLAIELAAARVGILDVAQISARLGEALQLLNGGRRSAEPRQQTLRGALDWSHELLDDKERRLFRRLAVFAGGFTLEAAEKVASDDETPEGEVLELLSDLADKSLVVTRELTRERRHRLLEPVRQYALEKLEESGEYEELKIRHARWCVDLAERAEPELTGPDQGRWINHLETEHDNLRAALGWALEGGDTELGLRLAGSLWLFWYTHGHTGEGRQWLELSVSRADDVPARLKARALNGTGWIAIFQRDYETAEKLLHEGAALYREIGDAEGVGACLSNMLFGAVLADREIEDYRWCMNEIDTIKPQLTQSRTLANIMLICGIMKLGDGELERARSAYQEAHDLYREAGDVQGTAMAIFNLAFEAIVRGEAAEADSWSRESLRVSSKQDDKLAIMYALWMSGCCAADKTLYERAARLWGASESLQESHNMSPAPIVMNLTRHKNRLARACAALGDERLSNEWRKGKAMAQERSIEYALTEETPAARTLTPREREVSDLVARGLSNRQISEELVISTRTAETHLKNIFDKLGVSSRAEIADRLEHQS